MHIRAVATDGIVVLLIAEVMFVVIGGIVQDVQTTNTVKIDNLYIHNHILLCLI